MASVSAVPPRSPAIDMVKGLAILWVLLIHSRALGESPLFYNLVNHAVPIFIVVFGLNSELWWRRRSVPRDLSTWYQTRARRIVVPMWGMLLAFWTMVLVVRPRGINVSVRAVAVTFGGWLAQVGTGWFVTMILQMVLVFPLLHVCAKRWGAGVVLAVGLVCTVAVVAYRFDLIARWTMFPTLVFSPRFYGHVAFGILLAGVFDRLGLGAAALATAAIAPCVAVRQGLIGAPEWMAFTDRLVELPLTVLLLALCRLVPRIPLVTAALVWLGQSSYGVYLGQLLVHNAFVFRYGLALYTRVNLWLYTLALLTGALAFVWIGEHAMRAFQTTTRRLAAPAPGAAT
jgi:peptidoglycan/LPS O-acetylase OafA/YrhL